MDKELRSRPAPGLPGQGAKGAAAAVMESPISEEDVAAESSRQLEDQGWCMWRCEKLSGDVIVVIANKLITGYPKGYPVYALRELKDILPLEDQLLQAAHRAKKALGARISGPEGPAKEGNQDA